MGLWVLPVRWGRNQGREGPVSLREVTQCGSLWFSNWGLTRLGLRWDEVTGGERTDALPC